MYRLVNDFVRIAAWKPNSARPGAGGSEARRPIRMELRATHTHTPLKKVDPLYFLSGGMCVSTNGFTWLVQEGGESAVDTYMSYSLTMNIHRSTATVTVEYDDSSQWKTLINWFRVKLFLFALDPSYICMSKCTSYTPPSASCTLLITYTIYTMGVIRSRSFSPAPIPVW